MKNLRFDVYSGVSQTAKNLNMWTVNLKGSYLKPSNVRNFKFQVKKKNRHDTQTIARIHKVYLDISMPFIDPQRILYFHTPGRLVSSQKSNLYIKNRNATFTRSRVMTQSLVKSRISCNKPSFGAPLTPSKICFISSGPVLVAINKFCRTLKSSFLVKLRPVLPSFCISR